MDWSKYPDFSEKEFRCKATGQCQMEPEFMELLQKLRAAYGKPIVVTSGYRSTKHPEEVGKIRPGAHTYGVAVDIRIEGVEAFRLVKLAYDLGFRRIGLAQKGSGRFIHLDIGDRKLGFPQAMWTY